MGRLIKGLAEFLVALKGQRLLDDPHLGWLFCLTQGQMKFSVDRATIISDLKSMIVATE